MSDSVSVSKPSENAVSDAAATKTGGFPGSVLKWLTAGYPEGIPPKDRFPLIALLGRTSLTAEQVRTVVLELVSPNSGVLDDGSIDSTEISTYIRDVTHAEPSDDDISRVAARLAAGGWPLADPALAGVASEASGKAG